MPLFTRSRAQKSPERAFTLLELIVVIVILGLLAAIAVPTFQSVIEKSQDAATKATLSAMMKDAQALVAFQDGTSWDEAMQIAAEETAAFAPGISAAGKYSRVKSTSVEPILNQTVVYTESAGRVAASLASPSGRICVGAVSATSYTAPSCFPASAASAGAAGTNLAADVLSGAVALVSAPTASASPSASPSPTPEVTASPSPVQGLVASASGTTVSVSWTAPSDPGTSPITSYEATLVKGSTPGEKKVVTLPAALSTSFAGVAAGTYSVSVVARSSHGYSDAVVSSSVGVGTSAASTAALVDSPSLYLPLDDASNSTVAAALAGPAGAYQAPSVSVSAPVARTSATRSDRVVVVPYSAASTPSGSYTVEAWYKGSNTTGVHSLVERYGVSKGGGYLIRVNNGVPTAMIVNNNQDTASTHLTAPSVAAGVWHHYALRVTKTGTSTATVDFFVNGVKAASAANQAFMAPTSGSLILGSNGNYEVAPAHYGPQPDHLDEVAVYPVALSDARIAAHYNAG